ncbi:hypothetical protein DR64_6651 [Paraburkholderia xenovorans LB400]|jgi:hypothetical protein|nr:hypothetical protein [Paraburkholderia xenovorans]AIP35544.1 hypothetical protein DR64_6651 [Paraburkholderia xenovorans LB400]
MRDGGPHPAYHALPASFPDHSIMPTPSRFKAPLILVITFVLLFAGVAVLIGVFGLLVKLFGHG